MHNKFLLKTERKVSGIPKHPQNTLHKHQIHLVETASRSNPISEQQQTLAIPISRNLHSKTNGSHSKSPRQSQRQEKGRPIFFVRLWGEFSLGTDKLLRREKVVKSAKFRQLSKNQAKSSKLSRKTGFCFAWRFS